MIKYRETSNDITIELECQTIGELIEYLNYYNNAINEKAKTSVIYFTRPDRSNHFPKIEIIDGEEWYVNDGQQPIDNYIMVDVLIGGMRALNYETNALDWRIKERITPYITHWRLAKKSSEV